MAINRYLHIGFVALSCIPMKDASSQWIDTIERDDGYSNINPATFRSIISGMSRYGLYRSACRYIQSGDRLLEAGCGWATASFALARNGVHTTALDISEKLIADLQSLAVSLGAPYASNVEPVVGDIFKLDALGTTYDAILSDGTYEHFLDANDRKAILSQMQNALTDGGVLLVSVPNIRSMFFGGVVDQKMPAMQPFTMKELVEEIKTAGFTIYETGYSFVNPGFRQWVKHRWMVAPISLVVFVYPFFPRFLKAFFAAHLYCIARKS